MNFEYLKILLYCNSHSPVPISDLKCKFKLTDAQAKKLTKELKEQDYIYYVGDSSFSSSYKSETIIISLIFQWLFNNLLAIIAIVISIIALFK